MEKIKSKTLAFILLTLITLLICSIISNFYFYQKYNQFFNDANASMTKNKELTRQLSSQDLNVKKFKDSQEKSMNDLTAEIKNLKGQVEAFAKQASICDTVKQSMKFN